MTGSGLIVGILHRYTSARDIMCSKQLIKDIWTLSLCIPLFAIIPTSLVVSV